MPSKTVRQVSFITGKGDKALKIYDNPKYGYNKSQVVIELLDIYREYEEKYGEDAFYKMKEFIRNS